MRRTALTLAIAAALAAVGTARAFGGPQEDLAACGAIADPTERLACYDRVAGRPATPGAPAAGAPKAAPAAAPASQASAPGQPPAAPSAQAATRPAQAQGAAAASSFGSYQSEHPVTVTQVAQSLNARITAMGKTIDGRPTVTLEGGALWLLDEVDPLLAVGDTVTINRGVFGSFLLETSTKRLHHVRRIR
jgi:hypothetical protein